MVTRILQDRYGFMWFATKDGLNQYDGYHFKIFRHDADDSTSLSDSYVHSMREDSQGRIWVGTASGSLNVFHRETETFEHIKLRNVKGDQDRPGTVYDIVQDRQGTVWVLCTNRLFIIRLKGNDQNSALSYSIKELTLPFSSIDLSLLVSKSGQVYIYDIQRPKLYVLNRQSEQWSPVIPVNDFLARDESYGIYGLLEDTTTQKLYALVTAGILQIDSDSSVELVLSYPMVITYRQFFIDKAQNIWFTCNHSLGTFNVLTRQMHLLVPKSEEDKIKVGMTHSMFMDESGMVWIGTKGYGLMTLNTRAQRFHHLDKSSVFAFIETDDGRIGVNDGQFMYQIVDPASGNNIDTILMKDAKEYVDGFSDFSYPRLKDKRQRLWFANTMQLVCYDKRTRQGVFYPLPVQINDGNYETVTDLKEDQTGNIWVGTTAGLLYFNVTGSSWKIYKNIPSDKSSLSFNAIFTICLDPTSPQKYVWIGTNGGGLNCLDIATGKCQRYSVKDGLPNNVIYGILPDDDGNLWMSTNKGLSCFNPKKQTFKNYEEKDGLQSNEFNHNAYIRSKDGTLFFGGVNGYNYFKPREIASNPVVPKIAITDFKIRNESVDLTQKNSPLKTVSYLAKNITLPYSDDMLTFEFAALDFTAPDKNLYKYKMEGFDKDWVNSGNVHSATYTNLDPGTYTFVVKGSNKDGVWNEKGTSIQLTILPPWYMTWWFRTLAVVAILFAAYGFYRYRLNKALELQNIRNRIASDLHDEIGSNLSNISIFSKVARQRKPETPQVSDLLGKISEYTQTSMNAMNDIVWMINARNDRFENIMVRMRTLASELFEATKLQSSY
jgi:ligand-binding sensor domain-containing protein